MKTKQLIFKKDLPTGCSAAIRNYPDKFLEFKFKIKIYKTPDEWVEYLRNRSNPETGEVLDMKTKQLIPKKDLPVSCKRMLSTYPEKFLEFKFKKITNNTGLNHKTPDEWVQYIRRKIFKSNIDPEILKKNLPESCKDCIRTHPNKFLEFKFKKRKHRSVDDWINYLKKHVNPETGIIPESIIPMRGKSSQALKIAIWKNPNKFTEFIFEKDIKNNPKRKSVKEWVTIAEKLAKDNDDILPTMAWLKKNNYKNLINHIYQSKELFKHITRSYENASHNT
jgi:hypothetical protein